MYPASRVTFDLPRKIFLICIGNRRRLWSHVKRARCSPTTFSIQPWKKPLVQFILFVLKLQVNARGLKAGILIFSTYFFHLAFLVIAHNFMKSRSRDGLAAKGLFPCQMPATHFRCQIRSLEAQNISYFVLFAIWYGFGNCKLIAFCDYLVPSLVRSFAWF